MSNTQSHRAIENADCPGCEDQDVREIPEAGYACCMNCGERGYLTDDGVEWWRDDPNSQWYVSEDEDTGEGVNQQQ